MLPVAPARAVPIDGVPAAVLSALQTPDVCLWSRAPGQDASHLIACLLQSANRLGERVLYLACSIGSIERTLARLADDPNFLAIRYAAPGERVANGVLTRFGVDEQRSALHPRLASLADDWRSTADDHRLDVATQSRTFDELRTLTRERDQIESRRREHAASLDRFAEDVRREIDSLSAADHPAAGGPFAADFAVLLTRHRERLAEVDRGLVPLEEQRIALEKTHAELTRETDLVDAELAEFRAGAWWTFSYWQGLFRVGLRRHADSLMAEERQIRETLARLVVQITERADQRQRLVASQTSEVQASLVAETERRRREIETQIALLATREADLRSRWESVRDRLPEPYRPAEPTSAALERCRSEWTTAVESRTARLTVDPHQAALRLLDELPAFAPVVAGTTLALARNPAFARAAEEPFDLIIVDDADRLSASDLTSLLGHAPRALFVGVGVGASAFAKLWSDLHRPEAPTSHQWSRGDAGFECTLRPVPPADERFLESECLADFPEIELRILSKPGDAPKLAQVVFPARLSARDAKSFIYRELQEASINRVDRPRQFLDSDDRFVIVWECPQSPESETFDLEPGLRETICVHGRELDTCRLEFDKSAGWTTTRIHDWLRTRLPTLDARRTFDIVK